MDDILDTHCILGRITSGYRPFHVFPAFQSLSAHNEGKPAETSESG